MNHFVIFIFVFTMLNTLSVFAGPSRTTYQAKIIKPDGYPLEAISVNFKFTILDMAGSCILYSETFSTVNMGSSAGLVSFSLGTGVRTFPISGSTFEQVFSNTTASLTCDSGGPATYSPSANDTRKIVMQFNDSSGWQTLPAMTINAVPYAMYANDSLKFSGKDITEFVQVASLPTCGVSEAMRFNGVGFSCISAGGSGTVTSGSVISALGYTPADGVSVTALSASLATTDSTVSSVSSTVFSVSSTVFSVSSTVTSLQSSVAASFAAITSSQWTTSGTNIFYNTGNIGIGTTTPVTKLDVSGGVRIGGESTTCAPALAGTLRYNASNVEYCNGTSWQAFGVSSSGLTSLNGSTSQTQIFANVTGGTAPAFNTSNGVHTLNIPLASTGAVTAGLISNADYTTFTNKITSSAASIAQVLGYVPANDAASGTYAQKANNLSDLTNIATARTNLGLGTFATASSIDLGSASATGTLAIARLPSFTGDATIAAASNTIVLSNSGVTAGTYTKVTVDTKGRVTSGTQIASSDVTAALGYTPASATASTQWTTSGSAIYYNTGNVGIGTSNPVEKFVVNGKVILGGTSTLYTGASSFPSIAADATNASALILNGGSITNTWRIKNANGVLDFLTCADATCAGGSQYMKLSAADGLMTPAAISFGASMVPGTNQYIFNGNASPVDLFAEPYPFGDNAGSDLYLRAGDASTGSTNKNGGTLRLASGKATGAGSSNIEFRTADSTNVTTKMYINGIGNVGIGTTAPTAKLHLASGTTSVAPFKFTSGTLLTSPQSGTMEYDGTNFYLTDSTNTRRAIAANANPGTYDNVSNINSSSNITLTPTGAVVVSSTTASTNSSTGALVVKGGLGVAGDIYTSGTIVTSSNIQGVSVTATSGMISPYIYGSTLANGNLRLESTTNNTKGYVLLASQGGNVGVGVTSTNYPLQVSGTAHIDSLRVGFSAGTNFLMSYNSTSTLSNAAWGWNLRDNFNNVDKIFVERQSDGGDIIFGNGNVGIGTSAPSRRLEIQGTSPGLAIDGDTSTSQVYTEIQRLGTAQWEYGFDKDADGGTEFYLKDRSNNSFPFAVLQTSGNVGVGTTSPSHKLQVNGRMSTGVAGTTQGGISIFPSNAGSWFHIDNKNDNTLRISTGNNPSDADLMTLNSNGNVGIGTNTPNSKLDVNGIIGTTWGTAFNTSFNGTWNQTTTGYAGLLQFEASTGKFYFWNTPASATANSANPFPVQSMTIDKSGDVGIGTASPISAKLHLQSGGYGGTPADANNRLKIESSGHSYIGLYSPNTFDQGIHFGDPESEQVGRITYRHSTDMMQFRTNAAERMVIDSSGNVGIGTTSPGYNLTVSSGNAGGYTVISNKNTAAGGQDWRWYSSSTGAPLGTDAMCFGTGACLFTLYTTGNATLAGTLTQSSDARLKRDISSINHALDSITKIEGVTYYWKDNAKEQTKQMGLIAQNVEAVFPEAVKTDTRGFKSVAYQNLVAPIINAIREIRDWMFKTDDRIHLLEIDNAKLKQRNADLEAYLCTKDPNAPFCK